MHVAQGPTPGAGRPRTRPARRSARRATRLCSGQRAAVAVVVSAAAPPPRQLHGAWRCLSVVPPPLGVGAPARDGFAGEARLGARVACRGVSGFSRGRDGLTGARLIVTEEELGEMGAGGGGASDPLAEACILVGVELRPARGGGVIHRGDEWKLEDSIGELAQLAETAGLEVVGSVSQKLESVNPSTFIGTGKVEEIREAIEAHLESLPDEVDREGTFVTVVFDDELSPAQARNLERALGPCARVCDRTALILDIFSQRARTREGMLQVQLAQSAYQLPRLTRMWTHLERQQGGVGLRGGAGEKQIDLDKRYIRSRMADLRRELEEVRRHRARYRAQRKEAHTPVVALVGYTNAGKSSLMNLATGANVFAQDRLFATLDPTTRRLELPDGGMNVLVTDTVGFIQKLPTQLVDSFRATLEEVEDADLLVVVEDISHPLADDQREATLDVLASMEGIDPDTPILYVWNKADLIDDEEELALLHEEAASFNGPKGCVVLSTKTGEGLAEFYDAVSAALAERLLTEATLDLPYSESHALSRIHDSGEVLSEEFHELGVTVSARLPVFLARQLSEFRIRV